MIIGDEFCLDSETARNPPPTAQEEKSEERIP
jgi:hypothetical protein